MNQYRILKFIILTLLIAAMTSREGVGQISGSDENWKLMLNDVKVRYSWSVKHGAYITKARFGTQVQQLDGKQVTLAGFFLAADLTGNLYVLSYNPMATCFFCSAAGIETVVEMEPHPDDARIFRRLRTDNFIEVKGILQLNPDNFERLVYILKDARLVRY